MCGNAPSAPQLPSYPGLTPDEQSILQKQGLTLDQFQKIISGTGAQLGQNQQILQQISGLYNPDGSINQTRLADLQQRTTQALQTQGTTGQTALSYLDKLYGPGGALPATTEAYTKAVEGKGPANQQLEYNTLQNFNAMKQQAAQQGIIIQGDDWKSATSESTAGQKLLQNFQQNYNIQNQSFQLGYLGTLGGNMGQLAGTGSTVATTGMGLTGNASNAPAGYVGQSITGGMSALTPFLTQYQQGLGQQYQPYYMQQIGPYQQQMAQAQANYQGAVGQYNAKEGQLGAIWGALMPAASFMGFGVNPTSGVAGLSRGVGSAGGAGGSNMAMAGAAA